MKNVIFNQAFRFVTILTSCLYSYDAPLLIYHVVFAPRKVDSKTPSLLCFPLRCCIEKVFQTLKSHLNNWTIVWTIQKYKINLAEILKVFYQSLLFNDIIKEAPEK